MVHNGLKSWQKIISKIVQKWSQTGSISSKLVKNGPRWFKVVQNQSFAAELLNSIEKGVEVNAFNISIAALNKSVEFNNLKRTSFLQPFGEEWVAYRFFSQPSHGKI